MSGRKPRRAAAAQVGLFGVVWVKNADNLPHGILGRTPWAIVTMNGHPAFLGQCPRKKPVPEGGRLYQPKAGTIA
jgi:hypothetical protein